MKPIVLNVEAFWLGLCILLISTDPVWAQEPGQVPQADQDQLTVNEITITARRGGSTVKIDRTVYDIVTRKDAASLSTVEVLKRLPGVFVDPSKKVTIRGDANVGFLLDGKPVRRDIALGLSADQIAAVEVITNPSAEFDASQGAIINLVLRASAASDWKGSISSKIDALGGYEAGVSLTRGGPKWTLVGSVRSELEPVRDRTVRDTLFGTSQAGGYSRQLTDQRDRGYFLSNSVNVKTVRTFSDTTNLSLIMGARLNELPNKGSSSEVFTSNGTILRKDYRLDSSFRGQYPYFYLTYESEKQNNYKFTAEINGTAGTDRARLDIIGPENSKIVTHSVFNYIESKIDYEKTFDNSNTIGAGFVASTNHTSDHKYYTGYRWSGQVPQDDFVFNRKAYATYVTYQATVAGLGVKPGLRFESFNQDLFDGTNAIEGIKTFNKVFPSIHVSKALNEHNKLKASLTLRTELVDSLKLVPSAKYISPYLVEQGNPGLRPPTKRQFEISHDFENNSLSLTQAIYVRDTKNEVSDLTTLRPDGVTVISHANLGSSSAYGYSISVKNTFSSKLTVSYDFELFNKRISAPLALRQFQDQSGTVLNSKLNLEYRPNKADLFGVDVSYKSNEKDLGIVNPETWTSEIQYSHNFANDVSLTVNLLNLGLPQTLTTQFEGPGFSGSKRLRHPNALLRIGISRSF